MIDFHLSAVAIDGTEGQLAASSDFSPAIVVRLKKRAHHGMRIVQERSGFNARPEGDQVEVNIVVIGDSFAELLENIGRRLECVNQWGFEVVPQ
jgi:hypothetical protein